VNKGAQIFFLQQLFKREEVVLNDDDCELDDQLNLDGQVSSNYLAPNMTCTEYNNAKGGCKVITSLSTWSASIFNYIFSYTACFGGGQFTFMLSTFDFGKRANWRIQECVLLRR
jgi:hypothetical protein